MHHDLSVKQNYIELQIFICVQPVFCSTASDHFSFRYTYFDLSLNSQIYILSMFVMLHNVVINRVYFRARARIT